MKHIPNALVLLFLCITLTRVAELAGLLGAGLLGWLFAAGLGMGVYGAAYWQRTTDPALRRAAGVTLAFFIAADGLFNSADVWRTLTALGIVSVTPFNVSDPVLALAGLLYAVFPTTAAALLGWMQGHVDRQPAVTARASLGGAWRALWRVTVARIERSGAGDATLTRQVTTQATPAPELAQPVASVSQDDATPATSATGDAPESDKARRARLAREYATTNGVSLRTAQRRLAEMAEQVTK